MLPNPSISGVLYGISGNAYNVDQIDFDPDTYHFTYGTAQTDITNDLYAKDKYALVPDFDKALENFRRANENGDYKGSTKPLNESTAGIFVDQLINDPLEAPLESLSNEVGKIVDNKGVKVIASVAIVGLLVYLVLHAD